MKSLIAFVAAFFVASFLLAQANSANWNTFLGQLSDLGTRYNTHYLAKEYQQAAMVIQRAELLIEHLTNK